MDAIDLFAGAGGFSTGARMAGANVVWAANHWPAAVEVHANNHPDTLHICQDLQQADWTQVPAHDLLMASPACQGHSRARGKERPHHDAQRSTAWAVVSAAEHHRPAFFLVENVPEFAKWELYPAWCAAMTALGYAMTPMVLDAADHGVAQHRRRLFIVGTRSRHPIALKLPRLSHVGAGTLIDFEGGKWSPIERPGRSAATLARIAEGRRVCGPRFLTAYYGNERGGRSLERPVGTITTRDRWAVIDGDRMRMLNVQECRRAMGFPDDYQLPHRAKDAMHMLGNAVVPPVARDVINALKVAA
ncbi:DNA cytosine methyltransferase [Quisquiliibacterium transsilvanicum]|uniref:DNA (cytosine-5-)-methyltransferase n=1 Tax=Quisquiliibacterium transsilvanicum TaxID=1549638 RepID=A0A7W8M871_9BURK|nr:DNA cytosine methyltransferase [Quisquiliibacterium transsilvanicum]MBB5271528.1 DNA (cytosine-5)-methyltransferase 1 [Quisquiliibacterium transsilvanicum]